MIAGHPRNILLNYFLNQASTCTFVQDFYNFQYLNIKGKRVPPPSGNFFQQIGIIWTTMLEGQGHSRTILCQIIFKLGQYFWTRIFFTIYTYEVNKPHPLWDQNNLINLGRYFWKRRYISKFKHFWAISPFATIFSSLFNNCPLIYRNFPYFW